MLDSFLRPYINPSLDKAAEKISQYNIPANIVTLAGFGVGMVGCFFLAVHSYIFALVFIAASRLLDGLDGAVARRQGPTDFGAYLDLVCDTVFYAAFIFFFVLTEQQHQLAGLFLIFSYIGMNASLIAYAAMAYKRHPDGTTNFFQAPGLVEGAETLAFMVLACLYPYAFSAIAFLFALTCWVTAVVRSMQAWKEFSAMERNYDDAESI